MFSFLYFFYIFNKFEFQGPFKISFTSSSYLKFVKNLHLKGAFNKVKFWLAKNELNWKPFHIVKVKKSSYKKTVAKQITFMIVAYF